MMAKQRGMKEDTEGRRKLRKKIERGVLKAPR